MAVPAVRRRTKRFCRFSLISLMTRASSTPGEKEDHSQDGLGKNLKEEGDRITQKSPGQENDQAQDHQRPARSGAKPDMAGHASCPMARNPTHGGAEQVHDPMINADRFCRHFRSGKWELFSTQGNQGSEIAKGPGKLHLIVVIPRDAWLLPSPPPPPEPF